MVKYLVVVISALVFMGGRSVMACEGGHACTEHKKGELHAEQGTEPPQHQTMDQKTLNQKASLDVWKKKRLEQCGNDTACIQKFERIADKRQGHLEKKVEKRKVASGKKHKSMKKHEHPGKALSEHPGEELKEHPGQDLKE